MPARDANWAQQMFTAAGGQLQGLQQQQFNLRQAVDSGQLRADPDAAAAAAKACRKLMAKLDDRVQELDQHTRQSGYGECAEGRQLQAKMQGKFEHAIALLKQEQDILDKMARTYEDAGKAYQQVEHNNQQMFRGQD